MKSIKTNITPTQAAAVALKAAKFSSKVYNVLSSAGFIQTRAHKVAPVMLAAKITPSGVHIVCGKNPQNYQKFIFGIFDRKAALTAHMMVENNKAYSFYAFSTDESIKIIEALESIKSDKIINRAGRTPAAA